MLICHFPMRVCCWPTTYRPSADMHMCIQTLSVVKTHIYIYVTDISAAPVPTGFSSNEFKRNSIFLATFSTSRALLRGQMRKNIIDRFCQQTNSQQLCLHGSTVLRELRPSSNTGRGIKEQLAWDARKIWNTFTYTDTTLYLASRDSSDLLG